MTDLPAPLIRSTVDLRDFDSMPLDLTALFNSDTWLKAGRHPFAGHALINLWGRAWHQVPAGSLPNDDDVLKSMSGVDAEQWPDAREIVLRGFVLCSDGRLYHPVICGLAKEVAKKQTTRTRTAKRGAKARWQHKKPGNSRSNAKSKAAAVPKPCSEDAKGREGKGLIKPPISPEKEFDDWYADYPNKVGKGQARNAWRGARKKADLETLKAGLKRYIAKKPPDVPWCNPSTWLNGERWTDEYAGGVGAKIDADLGKFRKPTANEIAAYKAAFKQPPEWVLISDPVPRYVRESAEINGWEPEIPEAMRRTA